MVVAQFPIVVSLFVDQLRIDVKVLEMVDWFHMGKCIIQWDGMGIWTRDYKTLKEAGNVI